MEGSLVKKAEIITACARLHNFIIANDLSGEDGDWQRTHTFGIRILKKNAV